MDDCTLRAAYPAFGPCIRLSAPRFPRSTKLDNIEDLVLKLFAEPRSEGDAARDQLGLSSSPGREATP